MEHFKIVSKNVFSLALLALLLLQAAVLDVDAAVQETQSDVEALSKEEAAEEIVRQYETYVEEIRKSRKAEWDAKVIKLDGLEMKFDFRTFGKKPDSGHSLFISMHGGGGTPARVNDGQWRNQIRLYEPEEGIYLAP